MKYKISKIEYQKSKILSLLLGFFMFNFYGCATAPRKQIVESYRLNGAVYYPLVRLCDLRNIDLQYDSFSRSVVLTKDTHKINLTVGFKEVLVDDVPMSFKEPVDIYQGTVVVPAKFKEKILDTLFKESAPAAEVVLPPQKIRKIVLDPGHGGNDPGAIGKTGLREKDVNLDIAKRLDKLLRDAGFEVVMTRSSDKFIPLGERAEIANNSNADLFISLHANANRVRSLDGFEVYHLSSNHNDYERAYQTARSAALNLDNASFASDSTELKAILWDMLYTASRGEAIELSRLLCKSVDDNLGVRILGVRQAGYQVLKETRMPAVLIEVGFLSNKNEEKKLRNSYYRQRITESIAQGINNYVREWRLAQANREGYRQ